MKKLILVSLVFYSASFAFSQDNLSMHFAQSFARFKYRDSEGNKDTALGYDFKSGFGVNYSKFFKGGVFIRPEFGYKNLGASSILNNQKLDWSLHYLDLNAGGGYLKKFGKLHPFIGASLYMSYLYKANQTIGVYYYDLLASKKIKRMDYGINLFGGAKYAFTQTNSIFFEIRNMTGLKQLEMNSESGQAQKLYNRAVSFHIGISFIIPDVASAP